MSERTHLCTSCGHMNDGSTSLCAHCGTPLTFSQTEAKTPPTEFKIRRNQVIARRYVVKDIIGRGGMGRIYKVHDNTLDESVALKTLHPEFVRDKMVLDRFFNEARIARQLSHPNIVRVHDIGSENSLVYISMELLPGTSLRHMLDAYPPGDRMPVDTSMSIFDQLCAALEYAHRFTIHRDIKPENVMVLPDGAVKLMDFGISKLMSNPSLTSASMVMGTPLYMSPEQLKHSANVDVRADIYSVGVMLYEVLTGQKPTGVPRQASEISSKVPPAFDPIIARCIHPDPSDRYPTAGALRAALRDVQTVITSEGPSTQQPAVATGTFSRGDTMRWLATAALVFVVLGLGFAGWIWAEDRRKALAAAGDESAAAGPATPPVESNGIAGAREVLALGTELRRASGALLADVEYEDLSPWRQRILDEAGDWFDEADPSGGGERAVWLAWNAVHNYAAFLTEWPESMVFIPARRAEPDGERAAEGSAGGRGFFIDKRPVNNIAFLEFVRDMEWADRGASVARPDAPVVNVTFYDAMAYAASREPPKRLPSETQWLRAAGFAQEVERIRPAGVIENEDSDETGESEFLEFADWGGSVLLEWTRTAVLGADAENSESPEAEYLFRSRVTLRGGRFAASAFRPAPPASSVIEDHGVTIGFRCVWELPEDVAAVREFVAERRLNPDEMAD